MPMQNTTKFNEFSKLVFSQEWQGTESIYTAIETTLTKLPAIYRFPQTVPKTFIVTTRGIRWNHEDIFTSQPSPLLAIAMHW